MSETVSYRHEHRAQKAWLRAGAAVTALALAVLPKATPHQTSPTPAEAFLAAATPATEVDYQLPHGGYETSILCDFKVDPKTHIMQLAKSRSRYMPDSKPISYVMGEHVPRSMFIGVIDPGDAEAYNVNITTDGNEVSLDNAASLSSQPFEQKARAIIPEGQNYSGSYMALQYVITHYSGEYIVDLACNNAFMEHWIDSQNTANQPDFARELFHPSINPAQP